MPPALVLASQSEIRAKLLNNAGIHIKPVSAQVDETTIKDALVHEGAKPRDIADVLADAKARKVASKLDGLVLGCDQVLAFKTKILSKPLSKSDAVEHLRELRGATHSLFSAAVFYDMGRPVWRHIGHARLTMRELSDQYITEYVERNWPSIQFSVGGYKIEEEGVRLFSRIEGDYFTVLGMPLIEILSYLTLRGTLPS